MARFPVLKMERRALLLGYCHNETLPYYLTTRHDWLTLPSLCYFLWLQKDLIAEKSGYTRWIFFKGGRMGVVFWPHAIFDSLPGFWIVNIPFQSLAFSSRGWDSCITHHLLINVSWSGFFLVAWKSWRPPKQLQNRVWKLTWLTWWEKLYFSIFWNSTVSCCLWRAKENQRNWIRSILLIQRMLLLFLYFHFFLLCYLEMSPVCP